MENVILVASKYGAQW